jgi:hypothetical protein
MRASPRNTMQSFLLVALLALAGAAWAQVAGKVVLAVGDVVAVRGSDRVRLAAGAPVNTGDTVVTGAQSHAQLRFADNALVALKPDSEFRIEQFVYNGREDNTNVAVFRLVRGGFRTLTGEIGRVNKEAYRVETTQATIGIRGTHYQLQACAAGQCQNGADYAAAGLYGGVFDGRIAVSSGFGGAEYGADEYFFVPNGEGPRRVLVPPPFLSDTLVTGSPSTAKAPRDLTIVKVPDIEWLLSLPVVPVPPFTYMATEDRNLVGDVLPKRIIVGSDRDTLELDSTSNPAVKLTINGDGEMTSFVNANLTARLGSAALVDAGSDGSAAGLNWGRWQGPGSTIRQVMPDGSVVNNDGGNLHYIYGNAAVSLPTSGQVTYAPVGGTRPTDSATGATGTLISAGIINVDFNLAKATLNGLAVGFTNATYTLAGPANIINGQFSTAGPGGSAGCTGNGCRPLIAGNFAGFFAGPGGTGIGLDYYFNTRGGGVIEGVAGYRKCPAPGGC